jgi:predicted Holliday junction resolvase-like endonuclease
MVRFVKLKIDGSVGLVSEIELDDSTGDITLVNPMEVHTEEFLTDDGSTRSQFTILVDWLPQAVTSLDRVTISKSDIFCVGEVSEMIKEYYNEVVKATYGNPDMKFVGANVPVRPDSGNTNVVSFKDRPKKPTK